LSDKATNGNVDNDTNGNIEWGGFDKLFREHYIFNLVPIETCQTSECDVRIKEIYNSLLLRDPNEDECNYNRKLLTVERISETEIINAIKFSKEYANLQNYSSMIKKAYNDLLKRDPDESGFIHFKEMLSSGKLTDNKMIDAIKSSHEYRSKRGL
jgi:hypothetical protein